MLNLVIYPYIMKATLTSDLFNKGSEKLVIKTCAEMLNYMPQIYGFIKDIGVEAKLTSNMYDASLVITGERLMQNIDKIVMFIESHGWGKDDY